jgi:hypothetical protein
MDRGRYVEATRPRHRGGLSGWKGVGRAIQLKRYGSSHCNNLP